MPVTEPGEARRRAWSACAAPSNEEFLGWFKSQVLKVDARPHRRAAGEEEVAAARRDLRRVHRGDRDRGHRRRQAARGRLRRHRRPDGQLHRLHQGGGRGDAEEALQGRRLLAARGRLPAVRAGPGDARRGGGHGQGRGGRRRRAAGHGHGHGLRHGADLPASQQQQRPPAAPASSGGGRSAVCPNCGTPGTGKFCGNCGQPLAPVARKCAECGSDLAPGAKFCGNCGKPVGG